MGLASWRLMNNARLYDRPKIFRELQVNVPRTIGILRDNQKNIIHSLVVIYSM